MVGADTLEAIAVCEEAISRLDAANHPLHPALLHLHIHLTEMSPTPERAMRSAERLGNLCPDAGHVHHMPGHVYVLCGDYQRAVEISRDAIAADRKYLAHAGPFNYYTTSRCHDLHLMMYASMMTGQFQSAIMAADEMCENLSEAVISQEKRPFIASTMEGYFSMRMHVLVRFGKWQDIIDTPLPQPADLYCVSTAMHHYAKGLRALPLRNLTLRKNTRRCSMSRLTVSPRIDDFSITPRGKRWELVKRCFWVSLRTIAAIIRRV